MNVQLQDLTNENEKERSEKPNEIKIVSNELSTIQTKNDENDDYDGDVNEDE